MTLDQSSAVVVMQLDGIITEASEQVLVFHRKPYSKFVASVYTKVPMNVVFLLKAEGGLLGRVGVGLPAEVVVMHEIVTEDGVAKPFKVPPLFAMD